ncbi:ComEA family DNA-binding protein [Urechidicola croceus]|uniref:Competence protein ComEA n=1 Tax=Urechidicola croceus TaxID=1850246 RepID=A0A1D8P6L8_9FLAO|nr:helix-hairpin-helix domain-containing protein [Urechidicola croceus]AOW20202.1 hypothetical protein LPB138_05710 [Urechidicola croceus]
MKNLKSHFWYNKRQRNGIFFLLTLIITFQLVYSFVHFSSDKKIDLNSDEITSFQNKVDELKLIELEKRKPKIYPFNPSFITDYKGYQLGMSTEEIDKLLAHRLKGGYINSATQFQKVTGVSDSLLAVLSPNFKFPDWITNKKKVKYNTSKIKEVKSSHPIVLQDLNTATAISLMEINGVGEKLSERIVKFRSSLNGFLSDDQLNEVYGLKPEVIQRIKQKFTVLSKPIINKVNVNTATFKEVLHLPYIDYELTLKIFQYRDEVAELQSIEELKNIEGFPIEKYDKIVVYLEAK